MWHFPDCKDTSFLFGIVKLNDALVAWLITLFKLTLMCTGYHATDHATREQPLRYATVPRRTPQTRPIFTYCMILSVCNVAIRHNLQYTQSGQ